MSRNNHNFTATEYLLLFLIVGASGNPAVQNIFGQFLNIFVLLIEILLYSSRISSECKRKAFIWASALIIIFVGQLITLGKIGYLASINYIIKVLTAIFAAYILWEKIPVMYLKLMSVLTMIAIPLWLLNLLGFYIPTFIHLSNHTDSIILYTQAQPLYHLDELGIHRNFGMFWEPGAFSGYISVAFLLFINHLDYLWTKYRKETIFLVLGLLSTFSTTGYVVLAVLLFFFLNDRVKSKVTLAVFTVIIALLMIRMYSSLDFMGSKIESQYQNAVEAKGDVNYSRFGAMLFDLQYIQLHPIFGNGLLDETRFSKHISYAENLAAFGNGFSGEIAYFGIPFMLFYLFTVYRNPSLRKKWRLLIALVLTLQGEYFMNYPLFFIFPFVVFFNEKPLLIKRSKQ